MRPNLRRTLAPISVVLYSLIPLSPLFERRMTCSDDGIFHIYKAVGLEAVVQLGHWLPRWSPHMAHGYGYPLYNFYAPLASYLMIGWHALGLIYPVALHFTLGLSIVLAGLAMFALVRDWWGEAAGLGAAVVYLTAPYLGFDVLYRGALAETVAWVFPPLLLWTLDRALQRGSWRWGAAAALAFAALIYTHNTTALVVAPLAGGYVLLLAWQRREWPDTLRGGAILAAGLALAAQFWLPALAERDLVQTERLLAPPIFTYNTNFITGSDLLALPAATNTALINPSPPKALGLVTALLALIGLAAAVTDSAGRSRKVFFGGALLFYGFMTLAPSQPLWDALPLIQFVQFPWRLLMPAALCAAILAGAAIEFGFRFLEQLLVTNSQLPITGSPKLAIGNWHLVTAVAIVIIAANLSWWYPRYCSDFMEQNVASMLDYEYATFTVGTSAKAEFLPDTAAIIPADDTLADALRAGAEPVRLAGLPEGATLETLQDDPLDFRARIDAPLDFTAEYRQFYYPGWSVTIDGETAPVRVAAETGLIRFDIPAGGHEMRVRFGSTPVRAAAAALSVLGLVAVGFAVVTADRRRPTTGISEQSTMGSKPSAVSDRWSVVVLAPLALLILKTTLIDTTNNPLHRTEVDPARLGTPISVALENGMDTLAYRAQPDTLESGAAFDASLFLTARTPLDRIYRPKFILLDQSGLTWNVNPDEALPPRWHREPPDTRLWPVGEYAEFARRLQLLPGTPPGEYQLFVTIFDLETLIPVRSLAASETGLIRLGNIRVMQPTRAPNVESLDRQYAPDAALGNGMTLVGFNIDRPAAQPGEQMLATLFLRADRDAPDAGPLTLALDGTNFQVQVEPTTGYPASEWRAGDIWRGQHLLRLPADVPAGDYDWTVAAAGKSVSLTTLAVSVPTRVFTRPEVQQTSDVEFGSGVALAGFSITPEPVPAGGTLEVTLVWAARTPIADDLRAFVHVLSPDGALVAQSDGVPANWTRPTPGWLPGEFVTDAHAVALPDDLPAGEYSVLVGFSIAGTGARVPAVGSGAQPDGRARIGALEVRLP